MTRQAQHDAAPATSTRRASANSRRTTDQCAIGVLTLDGVLADPMVQSLMHRDGTDAAAVRRLWEHVAAGRPAQTGCPRQPLAVVPHDLGHLLYETARLWRRRYERVLCARLPGMTCARCAVLLKLEQPGDSIRSHLRTVSTLRPSRLPDCSTDWRRPALSLACRIPMTVAHIY